MLDEEKQPKSTTSILCQLICALPLPIYAIYVGRKYSSGSAACSADATWLFVWGCLSIFLQVVNISMYMIKEQTTVLKILGGFAALTILGSFGWCIYGIELFFKNPICAEQEAHLFGKILAWISVILFSICGFTFCLGVPAMLATGKSNEFVEFTNNILK